MKKKIYVPLTAVGGSLLYGLGKSKGKEVERNRWKSRTDPKDLQPGDILKVDRGPYMHYAIMGNDGEVIEYGHENRWKPSSWRVAKIPFSKFSKGSPVERETPKGPFSREQIVKRAESRLGKMGYGKYNFFGNNCEYFARDMAEGKAHSTQVEKNPIGRMYLKLVGKRGRSEE